MDANSDPNKKRAALGSDDTDDPLKLGVTKNEVVAHQAAHQAPLGVTEAVEQLPGNIGTDAADTVNKLKKFPVSSDNKAALSTTKDEAIQSKLGITDITDQVPAVVDDIVTTTVNNLKTLTISEDDKKTISSADVNTDANTITKAQKDAIIKSKLAARTAELKAKDDKHKAHHAAYYAEREAQQSAKLTVHGATLDPHEEEGAFRDYHAQMRWIKRWNNPHILFCANAGLEQLKGRYPAYHRHFHAEVRYFALQQLCDILRSSKLTTISVYTG
jgi:hypothetical protein